MQAAMMKSTPMVKTPVLEKPEMALAGVTIRAASSNVVENIIVKHGSAMFLINRTNVKMVTSNEYHASHVKSVHTNTPRNTKNNPMMHTNMPKNALLIVNTCFDINS